MPQLLQPDVLARAESLGMKAKQVVEGLRVGDHRSPYRGFSIEFVQHREYVPGDDIKHIDWKSYARSDRYTIKQYEQETNFIAHLLVDSSNSMRYGDGEQNKFEYAKLLAASLTYITIRQRDCIALRMFDNDWRTELPVSGQMGHIRKVCTMLESAEAKDKTGMGDLLETFAERVNRRGIVFLISDCFDDVAPIIQGLQHIRLRGHEVVLFHVLHKHEVEFPIDGNVRFIDLELGSELMTRPHLLKPAYLRAFNAFLSEVQKGCDASRIEYVRMQTDKPMKAALGDYLVKRLSVAGR